MTPNSPSSHGSAESKHRSVQETEQFKKEENKHDEGKMFIGGLNWETSDENLKSYFSQFGEVTDCVVMRDPNSSRSRGFGFVTFTDPSNVDKVLNKDHQLDGKVIDPKRAIPRDEQEKTEKIFVGGIAPEVTEEEFKQYFLQFGNIVDATLMVDRDSGRPRGFGFITFDSSDPVEKAMARRDLEIQNKAIEVKLAMPKHKTQRFGHFGASYGPSSSPGGPPPPGSGPMSVIASPGNGAVNNGRYGSSYPMGSGKDGGGGGYSNMGGYNGGSYSGYGGYGGYSSYTNPYPGNYHHYNAMPQTYYSSRYGGYNNNYGGGGGYGGSGSRGGGGSYGQWYGRDGGAPGSGMNGGPASSSRLGGGGGYRHSPVREEYNGRDHHYHYHHHHHPGNPPHPPPPPPMYGGRGGNATRGAPLRSYSSSLNTGSTGAIYASHSVRGQHDYHPYPR